PSLCASQRSTLCRFDQQSACRNDRSRHSASPTRSSCLRPSCSRNLLEFALPLCKRAAKRVMTNPTDAEYFDLKQRIHAGELTNATREELLRYSTGRARRIVSCTD